MSCSNAARLSQRRRSSESPHLLRDQIGKQRDAVAVTAGIWALRVNDLSKCRGNVVEIVLIDDRGFLGRLERENRVLQAVRAQRLPKFRSRRDALECGDHDRIEPGGGSAADFELCGFDAFRCLENIDDLRQQRNPRIDRNLGAA